MDRGQNMVVAQTHTLSKHYCSLSIRCTWTLRHTRIAILGFVTHYLVQTPLKSKSYVYLSRLVKTRDPYPGLFQLAFVSKLFSSLPSLLRLFLWTLPFIHFYFQLYTCLYLVEALSSLHTRRRPVVVTHRVYKPSHVLLCHQPSPSRTNA
jgi:hypothetical protein